MKKLLLTCSLLFAGAIAAQAWNVDTQPTMQSALIEEFTGINCPNCPDGHRIAAELMNLHPEDVHSIAIHAGSYAEPTAGMPDFITETGTAIHDHFEITGYPCGTISRQEFDGSFVQNRGEWGSCCRTVIDTPSPVNLWSGCAYNPDTRVLTVDVEGYLTDNMTDPRLNVFLLQSEILACQAGGQLGNEYPHRHMLRDRLSGDDFGDLIAEKTKGEYFKKTYTYTVPEAIKDIPVDMRNVEIISFVTDGQDNVRKVSTCHPELTDAEPIFSVDSSESLIPIGKNWAFDFVEVWLNNHGTVDVTEADFDITINDKLTPVKWTGLVPARTNQLIRVPLGGLWKDTYDRELNEYIIRMMKVNGNDVETSSIRGKFYEIATYPTELTFKIKTDVDAADNTFRILDEQGNIVREFGPYEKGTAQEYTEQVELEQDKVYCFEVTDCWGDGIRHPLGYVKIFNNAGKQVVQYREIELYGMRQFFRADASLADVDDIVVSGSESVELFDLAGRRVTEPLSGVYIERTTKSDGTVVTVKKIIH